MTHTAWRTVPQALIRHFLTGQVRIKSNTSNVGFQADKFALGGPFSVYFDVPLSIIILQLLRTQIFVLAPTLYV